MLPKAWRLTRSDDYARVRRSGRSRGHPLLVLSAASSAGETTRVGFAVGRRIGSAVARNRVKRLLREAVRARLDRLQRGYDIVVIARPEAAGADLAALGAALEALLARAGLLTMRHEDNGRDE